MTWDEVCADPCLQDLPYKIETNQDGEIIMSPARNEHSLFQSAVFGLLNDLMPTGIVSLEYATETNKGVKVPDVVWMTDEFLARHLNDSACTESPQIVVEVFSDSNTRPEMRGKMRLFFERGAVEFWLVERGGRVRFYTAPEVEAGCSSLCPQFPNQVEPGLRPGR